MVAGVLVCYREIPRVPGSIYSDGLSNVSFCSLVFLSVSVCSHVFLAIHYLLRCAPICSVMLIGVIIRLSVFSYIPGLCVYPVHCFPPEELVPTRGKNN